MLMLQQQHSKSIDKLISLEKTEVKMNQPFRTKQTKKYQTLSTLAAQAKGRNRCGTAAVASSTPAPNSIKRSPANRNCNTITFRQEIVG
jgi:hypothetical protein